MLEINAAKVRAKWERKNDEAFGIIVLTLSSDQAGQFLREPKAKKIWDSLKQRYAGNVEDRRIDVGLELENIKMRNNKTIKEYITRAKNIASRSATLSQEIASRELTYHIARGVHPRMEKITGVLRAQRSLTVDEVKQALSEEEVRLRHKEGEVPHTWKNEKAYRMTGGGSKRYSQYSGCFICGKKNHQAKNCFHRSDRVKPNEHKDHRCNIRLSGDN